VVQYYIILTFLFFAGFTVTSNYTVTIHHQTTTNYNPFDTKSVFNLNSLTVAETKKHLDPQYTKVQLHTVTTQVSLVKQQTSVYCVKMDINCH